MLSPWRIAIQDMSENFKRWVQEEIALALVSA